ncbi:MAG TPA: TIGR03885 family FMN-dependent LLM class oxidoreductase [Acidimicrobiales bacterium]|nr:TIGR03885 family FMN-dependent LLM class oxidoreductase [Acidimicrobiales bacterium]
MATIGYHASHEQHPPSRLLRDVRHAESAGFATVSSSDHLSPWSSAQGESGFAWSWLGAAMSATDVPFGVVNAPGQRYHPVIVAQAIATLGEMFPGRLTVAMGSGEASNEHVTGDRWPAKSERNARLGECVAVIRALLAGDEVSHDGHVRVDRARLWTLPPEPVPLVGAALSEATARWCGSWAEGLLTVHRPPEQLRPIVEAFREGGGEGKPVRVQVKVAWDPDEGKALAGAHAQWRTNVFDSTLMADLERVEQFEVAATHVRPDDVRASVLVSSELGQHAAWLHETLEVGIDDLVLHHVPVPQEAFIDAFGEHVIGQVTNGGGS